MPRGFFAAIATVLLVPPALARGPAEWIQLPASGNAHNNVQPTVIVNYILRVL